MKKRVITSIFIVAVIVAAFLLRQIDIRLFNILVFAMAFISAYELTKAMGDRISKIQRILVLIYPCLAVFTATFFPQIIVRVSVVYLFSAIILMILNKNDASLESIALSIFSMVYPTTLLLGLSCINYFGELSLFILLSVFTTTTFSDVGAYLFGSLFKGPKLCESISPNKTISGGIGGLVGGVIAMFATYFTLKGFNLPVILNKVSFTLISFLIMSGIFLSVVTQFGDLFESYVKRQLKVKDMGSFMPGHGGMLDRIDGLAFVSFITFVLYSLLV